MVAVILARWAGRALVAAAWAIGAAVAGAAATGAVETGVAATGVAATGAVVTGVEIGIITTIITVATSSSSGTLVFHGGAGIRGGDGITDTVMVIRMATVMAMATHMDMDMDTDTTAAITATRATATATGPRLRKCSDASLAPATIMGRLTELWGLKRGGQFALTSGIAVDPARVNMGQLVSSTP